MFYWIVLGEIVFEKIVQLIHMTGQTRLLTRRHTSVLAHAVAQLKLEFEIERLQFGFPLEPKLLQMKQLERVSFKFGYHRFANYRKQTIIDH